MAKPDGLSKYVDDKKPVLWSDKKRYLGLPISFTKYWFDEDRLYIRTGFLNIKEEEILLYRVLDVKVSLTLSQRMFGVGSVILYTADQSTPKIEIKNIKDAERIRKALSTIVEKERDEKRVLGKEMYGAHIHDEDADGDGMIDGIRHY